MTNEKFEPRQVSQLTWSEGFLLYTRNGKVIGNGIIVGVDNEKELYHIETDFGQKLSLNEAELLSAFHSPLKHLRYTDWFAARDRQIFDKYDIIDAEP